MSDPLLPHLLAYLADPTPEEHDHAAVEQALADPARRVRLFQDLAALQQDPDTAPEDSPELLHTKALTGALAWWHDWLDGNGVKVNTVHNDLASFGALKQAVTAGDDPIRATGQRHSDNYVCRPALDSTVLDLRNWQYDPDDPASVPTSAEAKPAGDLTQVRVFGFEKLRNVMDRLQATGLALVNTGSYTGQTIAGPFSMGTHGSGPHLGAMPDGVKAVDLLGADGKVRRIRSADCLFPASETVTLPRGMGTYMAEACDDIPLEAAVVSMGSMGVVLSYIFEVTTQYWLAQSVEKMTWQDALARARTLIDGPEADCPRHIEILLRPDKRDGKNALLFQRSLRTTPNGPNDKAPGNQLRWLMDFFGQPKVTTAIGSTVSCSSVVRDLMFDAVFASQAGLDGTRGLWDQILVRDTGIDAHGFEVFFPYEFFEQGVAAVLAGIDAAAAEKAFVTAPIGTRFVKAGPHWLAMSHRRYKVGSQAATTDRWVTMEVPRMIGTRNQDKVPSRVLEALRNAGIPHRPHWGQYFPTNEVDTTQLYPRLPAWRKARADFGADAKFLTPTLAQLTGLPYASTRQLAGDVGVPGLGRKVLVLLGDTGADPQQRDAIRATLDQAADQLGTPRPVTRFMAFDDLLGRQKGEEEDPVDATRDALTAELGNLFRYRSARTSARSWLAEVEHWKSLEPQRLVRWLARPKVRAALRERLRFLLDAFHPDLVVAHGIGGLVAYDTLSAKQDVASVDLLTLGTPIGHQAFRSFWGGRVAHPEERVGRWFHLTNPDDPAFAAPLPVPTVHGLSLRTDDADPHAPLAYLGHPRLLDEVYRPLLTEKAPVHVDFRLQVRTAARRERKALLVGVDRYAGEGMDLEGCVNDVYGMSELLQRRFDYGAGDVRLLTNERASADALRERLEWLLADARPGDHRVLFFSGHGARLPSYNALEVVDQVDECLVLHDFDWDDPHTAFVDDEFAAYYAQLPYGVRFTAIFDCCHGGGMTRSSGARVRGLTPPDDIRHRMLSYKGGSWQDRFADAPTDRLARIKGTATGPLQVSSLGAGLAVRPERQAFEAARAERRYRDDGPFMPLLAYACAEGELSFEHQVGAAVHGAFTWTLLQKAKRAKLPSFRQLVEGLVRPAVRKLGYAQTAEASGPGVRLDEPFAL